MTQLSVNVNRIALLRNSRKGTLPNVVKLARHALEAGAHGITVHPRPDERHIRSHDVDDIAALLNESAFEGAEFNIEGNPFIGPYVEHVRRVRPTQCTLVPDDPGQTTSDHGWDIPANQRRLAEIVEQLQALGARVSLFMDPDMAQIEQVPATGADRIELYTEGYADAFAEGGEVLKQSYTRYKQAAERAHELGLGVNAGHDLNLDNLPTFARLPHLAEVSIGHALIADALEYGISGAVQAYLQCLAKPRPLTS
jgi:pyridoxine 5-phosphate synthase